MDRPRENNTSSPRRAIRRESAALFLLREALALGIRIGSNGDDVLMSAPLRIPRERRLSFEAAIQEYWHEIVALIMEGRR
jgi:hypothetical protein